MSWRDISEEIEAATGLHFNRSVISLVARGKRQPTNELIGAVNKTYNKRFEYHATLHVAPCAKCGELHDFKNRCPSAPRRSRRVYDISFARLRALMQSPYSNS